MPAGGRSRWPFAIGSLAMVCGCNALAGTSDLHIRDDATSEDVGDTSVDDTIVSDAGDAGGYHDFSDRANWTTFDFSGLPGCATGNCAAWSGAGFDGKYVYFVPFGRLGGISPTPSWSGNVVRYDITLPFANLSSWASFDLKTLHPDAAGFFGAAYDGKYLYLVPNHGSHVLRYDPKLAFGEAGSWTMFDLSTLSPEAQGFRGAAFDGTYVYFVPGANLHGLNTDPDYGSRVHGLVVRLDTRATFTDTSAWATFDATKLGPDAEGFAGAAFDGRFLYLAPSTDPLGSPEPASPRSIVVQLDTKAPFTEAGSWSSFDTQKLGAGLLGFVGAVFDGQYVYLVPSADAAPTATGLQERSLAPRFDALAGKKLDDPSAWQTFDIGKTGARSFFGAVFDGRYVTFASLGVSVAITSRPVARFETKRAFDDLGAWASFDAKKGASRFRGALFDGRYVYFAPASGGLVMRFDARQPAELPKNWNASFF